MHCLHYFCCGIGYISEAPGFAQHPENSFVRWIHIQPGKDIIPNHKVENQEGSNTDLPLSI